MKRWDRDDYKDASIIMMPTFYEAVGKSPNYTIFTDWVKGSVYKDISIKYSISQTKAREVVDKARRIYDSYKKDITYAIAQNLVDSFNIVGEGSQNEIRECLEFIAKNGIFDIMDFKSFLPTVLLKTKIKDLPNGKTKSILNSVYRREITANVGNSARTLVLVYPGDYIRVMSSITPHRERVILEEIKLNYEMMRTTNNEAAIDYVFLRKKENDKNEVHEG